MTTPKENTVDIAETTSVDLNSTVGYLPNDEPAKGVRIGANGKVRSNSIIYDDVIIGDYFQSGHNVLVREKTKIGNHVVLGTNSVIDGNVVIRDFVKIESNCYICTDVEIGSRVFFGPGVVLTNDKYPLKDRDNYRAVGPVIEDGVTLGAGVVVVPGVRIGEHSFVAAGAVVTCDVPANKFVSGVPGRVSELPDILSEQNMALSWRKYIA